MIISPSTTIKILSNVPLDTEYEHTIFFLSLAAQEAYFSGKTKYTFENNTYQRVNRNTMRVARKADDLYDCNYLMFQNTNFGNKWFYAYITSVEYINNEVSEITYDLDVMQTWHFDYTPDWCFVERCHTATDRIGEHLEPENVDVGELVFNDYSIVEELTEFYIIVAIVNASEGVKGTRYDQIYSGATLWAFYPNDTDGLNAKLEEYIESPDSILSMYCVPQAFITHTVSTGGTEIPYGNAFPVFVTGEFPSATTTIDGYLPHNCKLYTYPYNFWNIVNGNGQNLALRYEMFYKNISYVQCQVLGTITAPVSAALYPIAYKGSPPGKMNLSESISIGQFPQCAWATDAYRAWVAQNSIPIALGLASTAGRGMITGNLPGAAISGLHQISTALASAYQASIQADISRGSLNNGGPLSAFKMNTFAHGRMSVNSNIAQMIDSYFDMFGYSVRKMQKLMRNARPTWTFIKTIGANLTGSVPADDMKRIIEIYDRGCTFWQNGDDVGNYSLNNLATIRG